MSTSSEDVIRILGQIDVDSAVIEDLKRRADEVRPVLVEAARGEAHDADEYMRKNAIALLGAVGDDSSVDALVDLLDHDNPAFRANAIRSLASIGSPRAASGLAARLARAELPVTEGKLIVRTLRTVGGPDAAAAVETFRDRFARTKEASPGLGRDLRELDDTVAALRSRPADGPPS